MDNTSFAPGNNSINNSAPPPTPQYSLPEHKHFLNKKFIITFVILALVGISAYAGIWYWGNQQVAQEVVPTFTPRPTDPIADWKTYTNTQYGFEVKYPSDWSAKTNFNGSSFQPSVVTLISPEALQGLTTSSYQKNKIDIYEYNSINDLNTQYRLKAKDLADFMSQEKNDAMSFTKSIFNGLPAYDVKLGGEGTYFAIFFENGGRIYEIFFDVITSRSEITTLENQILSTFKFTGSTSSPQADSVSGQFCGGITGKLCPSGYSCKLDGGYPDAGGTCLKN